ncbi:MAG TPA: NUDIX hydrolase, partial [Myxococcaceae bacterium]|nr:NUDIX hydrolase [Myxococcaceae bacterium]
MSGRPRPPPWKRLRSGPALDFKVLKIREDLVADPRDGSEHARVVIESPEWVNIIPITPEGKVVLIRQFRSGIWSDTLEIPGGMVESGEEPIDAAKRELEEETGY